MPYDTITYEVAQTGVATIALEPAARRATRSPTSC